MSELVKVYAPDGEVFENSPVNARDLVAHAGWTYTKPVLKAVEAAVKSAPKLVEAANVSEDAPVIVEEAKVEVPEAVEEEKAVEENVSEIEEASEGEENAEAEEEVKTSTRGRKKKS